MKLSVCGKGGSGKSAIVTLLADEARARGYKVLVVDSDESNSGLFRMLGFDQPPVPLMEFIGGRQGWKEKMGPKPSSAQAKVPKGVLLQNNVITLDDIPPEHVLDMDNLRLVSVGKILHPLEGCACPMGVLSREFLDKLRLKAGELAIVDMEAGIEHFGRGVETSIDSVLVVVEPSFESLQLAQRINSLACGIGISNIWAVLNKITSDDMASKLTEELKKREVDVIGCIHYDPEIFQSCLEGGRLRKGIAKEEVGKILDSLLR